MNTNSLLGCIWTGPIFLALMLIGFVCTGFIPPIEATATSVAVAEYYQQNILMIRLGLVIMVFGAAFYAPFMAAVTVLMTRMGNTNPALIITFAFACAAVTIGLYVILVIWGVASYRPFENPDITRAFNDFFLLFLLWPGTLMPVCYLALGICIFKDSRQQKVLPRWFGFYNLWSALLALTGCFIIFFKTGPLAIDGILAYWVNLIVFFAWFAVMAYVGIMAAKRETQLEQQICEQEDAEQLTPAVSS